jgi:sec-independent protein translocase protein TatA
VSSTANNDSSSVFLAGILGSFEQDILFVVIALLLFGRRLPEVAGKFGKKMYQFRRGLDEMKSEIAKPIRDSIEAPIREASASARSAFYEAHDDVRRTALDARAELHQLATESSTAIQPPQPPAPTSAPATQPFPYPRAPRMPEDTPPANS